MTIPDFGSDGTDALPSLGENVPDPEHPGRQSSGDPDVTWPDRDDVVHGQQADCPDRAVYP